MDIKDLTLEDIGKNVWYKSHKAYEIGVITSFNEEYVFVHYMGDTNSKATRACDLSWVSPTAQMK
jgi:hypothetical protein